MHCGQPAEMCVDCGVTLEVFKAERTSTFKETRERCAKVLDHLAQVNRDKGCEDETEAWIAVTTAIAYEAGAGALRALKEGEG